MTDLGPISTGRFSHDLLLHDGDEELVQGVAGFVSSGLSSGSRVILHSTAGRVAVLREAFGAHPRLEYAADRHPFQTPSAALWAFQRMFAETPDPIEVWTAGTVPIGADGAAHPSWARFEALANVALRDYAFHALCTFDTSVHSSTDIAAARATHPGICTSGTRSRNPGYVEPAAFLAGPLARTPRPPPGCSSTTAVLCGLPDLRPAREVVRRRGRSSRVPHDAVDGLMTALNEVLVNALTHGATPVSLDVWVEPSRITCRITDPGPGIEDVLAGCRYPAPSGPHGLWLARQSCEEVAVENLPGGGCSVLLTTGSEA